MMVQATNNKQVNGISVIQLQGQNGTHHATTIIIDNGFTGHAIMSHSFAEKLGYEFQRKKGETHCTTKGNMNTLQSVTVANVKLPHLRQHRTFSATFKVAAEILAMESSWEFL